MTNETETVSKPEFENFEDVPSAEFRIKSPTTGAPTSMVVTLAGPEHPDRKNLTQARQRRARIAMFKTGKLQAPDPAEDAADQLDLLVLCTLGWEGFGVPFSAQEARKVYSDKKRAWLRNQVQAALEEAELFIRSSAPN